MKLSAKGVYLGMLSRTGKDNKVYNTVNVDFEDEIHSFNTNEPEKFRQIPKYTLCDFTMVFATYRGRDGNNQSYMMLQSAIPCK